MSRAAIAMPFLTLDDDCIGAGAWQVSAGEREFGESPAGIPGWDYRTALRVRRTLEIDDRASVLATGVGDRLLPLRVLVTLGTGAGTLPRRRRALFSRTIMSGEPCSIDLAIPPGTVSGRVWLRTDILLGRDLPGNNDLAPSLAGQRLWHDVLDTAIERSANHFPTEPASFATAFPGQVHANAPWYLQWIDADPERDLRGAVRLYLNTDDKVFIERAIALDPLTLQTMMADVMVQITVCMIGLDEPDVPLRDRPAGSLGRQAAEWLDLAFPDETPALLVELLRSRPGEFHAGLVAAAAIATEAS